MSTHVPSFKCLVRNIKTGVLLRSITKGNIGKSGIKTYVRTYIVYKVCTSFYFSSFITRQYMMVDLILYFVLVSSTWGGVVGYRREQSRQERVISVRLQNINHTWKRFTCIKFYIYPNIICMKYIYYWAKKSQLSSYINSKVTYVCRTDGS